MKKTIEVSLKETLFLASMNLKDTEEGIKYKAQFGCDPCDACGPSSCSDCKGFVFAMGFNK